MKERTKRIFHWEKDFSRQIVRIALPIALQNLVAASAHIVDGLMVAGLQDQGASYAAVTQAGRYSFLFQIFLFGAASGSSIFISQFWGKKDREGLRKVMSLCLRITGGLALLFCLGAVLFPGRVMSLFLPDGPSRALAVDYLSIVGFSYLLTGIDIVYANTLRSTGKPTVAMCGGIAAVVTNTFLNYVLINGKLGLPSLGVRGAAIGTLASAAVSLAINMGYTYMKKQPGAILLHQLSMPSKQFSIGYIKRVLPVVVNEGLWSLGMTAYSVFYGMRGDDAVNAIGVYNNIDQLMTVMVFGVVTATAILIGNRIGAGDREGAMLTSRRMLFATECLSLLTAVALITLRWPVLSFFGNLSEKTLEDAATIVLLAGCFMPFRHFNTINIVGVLRAGGDTIFSMVLDAGLIWVVGVPCVAIATLALNLPITLIFAATFIEELVKLCLGLPRFLNGKWINNLTNIGTKEGETCKG